MGTIQETWRRIKDWWGRGEMALLSPFIVILVGVASFALGRISATEEQKSPIVHGERAQREGSPLMLGGMVVASRSGKSYHFPWCSGAETMKDANRRWFPSEEAAQKAGYKPAGNCPGLSEE
jgi:hypothetical protein